MVTKKTESCTCENCKCDPCKCGENGCCKKGTGGCCGVSAGGWLRIIFVVFLIVGAYSLGVKIGVKKSTYGFGDREYRSDEGRMGKYRGDSEITNRKYPSGMMMNQAGTPMDAMSMNMRDMSKMLEGKTGDDLNRAFLEGMIPHHQAAVDMAKYLAASNKPELVKLGGEIIAAQTKEIEQMKAWQGAWGYTSTGSTGTGNMMMNHSMMNH